MASHSRSARSAYPEVYSKLKPRFRSARSDADIPACLHSLAVVPKIRQSNIMPNSLLRDPSIVIKSAGCSLIFSSILSSAYLTPFPPPIFLLAFYICSQLLLFVLSVMSQLVWLVTGCSSGFGSEFVRQILSRGDKIIATARNSARIESLASQGAAVLELDVTDSQDKIDQIIAEAIAIYGRIDVLVNNAGFVAAGSWEDLSYNEFVSSFETNVFGPIKITRAVLPHMRARKSGTMVFISSLSGWVGHQFTGAYAGSKFALEGVVESLHNETKSLGLRTLLMEPGRFRTPLLSAGHLQPKQSQIADYESASETHHNHLHGGDLKQPGNPEKFVEIVLDLVRQEGCAEGKSIPFRLPVGKDAVEEIGAKVRDVLETLQEWDSIITATNY